MNATGSNGLRHQRVLVLLLVVSIIDLTLLEYVVEHVMIQMDNLNYTF